MNWNQILVVPLFYKYISTIERFFFNSFRIMRPNINVKGVRMQHLEIVEIDQIQSLSSFSPISQIACSLYPLLTKCEIVLLWPVECKLGPFPRAWTNHVLFFSPLIFHFVMLWLHSAPILPHGWLHYPGLFLNFRLNIKFSVSWTDRPLKSYGLQLPYWPTFISKYQEALQFFTQIFCNLYFSQ